MKHKATKVTKIIRQKSAIKVTASTPIESVMGNDTLMKSQKT